MTLMCGMLNAQHPRSIQPLQRLQRTVSQFLRAVFVYLYWFLGQQSFHVLHFFGQKQAGLNSKTAFLRQLQVDVITSALWII